ncbi:MAG: hypothetical protein M1433_00650 [Candidatus Parvarchaeota archaeon]|nr:hypothetical protein [Candidatus Parvarchaeota archaeon]
MGELDEIYSKILSMLERGPCLTIDVAEAIGKDTTQTAAILDYYAGQNTISKTERRYGTSAVYYLKKDIDAAMDKIYQTLNNNEKTLVNKMKNIKLIKVEDLSPAERYISRSLNDFLKNVAAKDSETGKRVDYMYYYKLSLDDVKRLMNGERESSPAPKTKQIQKTESKQRASKRTKLSEPIPEEVKNMLFGHGFSGVNRVEQDVYQCEYGQNRFKTIVIVSMKPTITKRDLIKFAGYAAAYKTVVFVITSARKISDYSEYGSIINVIKI